MPVETAIASKAITFDKEGRTFHDKTKRKQCLPTSPALQTALKGTSV